MNSSGAENTTPTYLRSFSEQCDDEDEYDLLSPIDETPGDTADGDSHSYNGDFLPYSAIQKEPNPFQSKRENCWIPKVPIHVQITSYERHSTHVLNPNLYEIQVSHGEFRWTIKKRYKHFRQLHEHLTLYRATQTIPMPLKNHKEKRKTFNRERISLKFPKRPEPMVRHENIVKRMAILEKYLCDLLRMPSYRNHNETVKFFEVSHLSFVGKLGSKGKEGMVQKCSGGRRISIGCFGKLRGFHLCGTWNKRWFIVKDNWLAYIRPEDGYISDVMLMDSTFNVECGMKATGAPHGVLISNLQRNLLIKCWTSRKAREWSSMILEKAKSRGYDYSSTNRFQGFSPARENSYAHWFVDGASYFEAVAESLEKAKEEIFITDWWLSPEIYMKRPIKDGDKWRLDMILKRRAEAGVKIYILLYKEVKMALGIDSAYSKSALLKLHPTNIKVMRYPDHLPGGVLLWAHHEKMVVIDQSVAFLGGIDLCYGRWDTAEHRLTDLGDIQCNEPDKSKSTISLPMDSVATETTADANMSRDSIQFDEGVCTNDISINVTPATPDKLDGEEPQFPLSDDNICDENRNEEICSKNDPENSVSTTVVKAEMHSDDISSGASSNSQKTSDEKDSALLKPIDERKGKKGKQHLWRKSAEKKGLHFNIVGSNNSLNDIIADSSNKDTKLKSLKPLNNDNGAITNNEHEEMSARKSSDSQTSTSSQKELLESSGNTHTDDSSSGLAAVAKTVTMLNRLKKQEAKVNEDKEEEEDENIARSRWKKIFNLSRHQSTSSNDDEGQQQIVNEKLFMDDSTKSSSNKFSSLVERLRQKRGSIDIPDELLESRNKKKNADTNKLMQKTTSEKNIDEKGLSDSEKLWIGKDYVNFIHKDFVQLDAPFTDFIDRTECPRMPWHDIGAVVYGKSALDVARHFIIRWNNTKTMKFKKNNNYPFLLPKSGAKCTVPMSVKGVTYEVKSQILRSSCNWSIGIGAIEASIHSAYIHCIENAKHFIYIENQFFVTQIEDKSYTVLNGIGEALYRRIMRAYRSGEDFRVYVVMPLLPAFEGEFGTPEGTALQAVTDWNYASICRGNNSLIQRLSAEVADPLKYVVFCGLRTYSELNNKMVTELIYVHSKLMIVDDDTVIIGSANINDRSMLGKRDSELAVMIEDIKKTPVRINGKEHHVGRFASSLRTTIFREHLGLSAKELDITDVVSDSFYKNVWLKQAAINTTIYDNVFRCIPCDYVCSFQEMKDYVNVSTLLETDPAQAIQKLKDIKGYLVLYPREFLKKENLSPAMGTKEALLPTSLWT